MDKAWRAECILKSRKGISSEDATEVGNYLKKGAHVNLHTIREEKVIIRIKQVVKRKENSEEGRKIDADVHNHNICMFETLRRSASHSIQLGTFAKSYLTL